MDVDQRPRRNVMVMHYKHRLIKKMRKNEIRQRRNTAEERRRREGLRDLQMLSARDHLHRAREKETSSLSSSCSKRKISNSSIIRLMEQAGTFLFLLEDFFLVNH